jgi:hypothetical protein
MTVEVISSDISEVPYANSRIECGWIFCDSGVVAVTKLINAGLYRRSGSAFKELDLASLGVQADNKQGSKRRINHVRMS